MNTRENAHVIHGLRCVDEVDEAYCLDSIVHGQHVYRTV